MKTEVFLVDTTVWIHAFRQSHQPLTKRAHEFFRFLPPEAKLVTSGIILAEFIQGLGKEEKDKAVRKLLERYQYLPSTKEIYILAGEISKSLTEEGAKTPLSDCLIAATALTYEVTLVSDDPHFKRFKGLELNLLTS